MDRYDASICLCTADSLTNKEFMTEMVFVFVFIIGGQGSVGIVFQSLFSTEVIDYASNNNSKNKNNSSNYESKEDSNVAVETLVPKENVKVWLDLITRE